MRGTSALAAACLAVAAAACGGGKREPALHHVEIRAMQFVPADLQVAVGDTIEWRNADMFPHTATAAGAFDSASIERNGTWRHTITAAGRFDYVCTLHPTMTGRITAR